MTSVRRHHAVTLLQASEEAPALAPLLALMRESSERLQAIQPLIPVLLRPSVQAGPIEGDHWCLVVKNNAVAAKLRQLLPTFQTRLQAQGWAVSSIRLKVQGAG